MNLLHRLRRVEESAPQRELTAAERVEKLLQILRHVATRIPDTETRAGLRGVLRKLARIEPDTALAELKRALLPLRNTCEDGNKR